MYESGLKEPPREWTPEEAALAKEVQAARPKEAPFFLYPWAEVQDPVKYHERVLAEIGYGPDSARARTGALMEELRHYAALLRAGNEP